MLRRHAIVATVLALVAVSEPSPAAAISGGSVVEPGDPLLRQTVDIRIVRAGRRFVCTGFLYSPDHIVTAAHCFTVLPPGTDKRPAAERKVIAAEAPVVAANDITVRYLHARITAHPKSVAIDRPNDLAFVTMAKSHPTGHQVPPLDSRTAPEIVEQAKAASFVHVGVGRPDKGAANSLRKLVGTAERLQHTPQGRVVITQAGNFGTCAGDSGGPVYIVEPGAEPKIVGIHLAGRRSNEAYSIKESGGRCSRVSIFYPAALIRQWIDREQAPMRGKTPAP